MDIRLPDHLIPSDGRFGSGPSKVRQEAVTALAEAAPRYLGTSHRRPAVKSVVGRIRSGLRDLFSLPEEHEVVLGVGGATQFWDIAAFCLIERRSQHLVCGEFSAKFAAAVAAAPHLDDPQVIESDPGTHPDPQAAADVDAYAFPHNETSTGVALPVKRPAADGLVLVDGTSAAGGTPVDPAHFDAYYFSPQKCFGSEGGLWLALCSPAAVDRAQRLAAERPVPPSLDLAVAIENSRADQTYNTPGLATLFLLAHQIEWMLGQGGLDWAIARCDRSAEIVYSWAEASSYASPYVVDPGQRSHTVATIDLAETVDAGTVTTVLREHGIVDIESYRKLGRNQLRLALFPAIDPEDLATLTLAIDHVAGHLGA